MQPSAAAAAGNRRTHTRVIGQICQQPLLNTGATAGVAEVAVEADLEGGIYV